MNITDELREYANELDTAASMMSEHGFSPVAMKLTAIADRIDAEHERVCKELVHDAYMRGKATADDAFEEIQGTHVKLPVDADGEPWRLGDELMMEGEVCEVVGIGGKTIFYAFGDGVEWTIAHNNRHHHAPTVEDVLRDMNMELDEVTALYVGEAIDSDERDRDEARIFAKYASKLRLAGEDA